MSERLNSRMWRHDGYTLNCLQRALAQEISQLPISLSAGKRSIVVDYGCGDSPYRSLFNNPSVDYVTCDIETRPGVDVVLDASGFVPLPDCCADCVVSFQVLEHIWDIDLYLAECKRLLKPGGQLLLSTHGTWLYHPHPEDYRRWTSSGLRKELESREFGICAMTGVVGPLAWTTQFRAIGIVTILWRAGRVGKFLAKLVSTFMYIRMWTEDRLTPAELRHANAAVYIVRAGVQK